MRIPGHVQNDIVRLHLYDLSQSKRGLGRTLSESSDATSAHHKLLPATERQWFDFQALDHEAWIATLATREKSIAPNKNLLNWHIVHDEAQKPNARSERLWQAFRIGCIAGLGNTPFSANDPGWLKSCFIAIQKSDSPRGKPIGVFPGARFEAKGRFGDLVIDAKIRIAAQGFSNCTLSYTRASPSTSSWISCRLSYFSAIDDGQEWLMPAYLKAAILRSGTDISNPVYSECLWHCPTAPPLAGKPKRLGKPEANFGAQSYSSRIFGFLQVKVASNGHS